MLCKECFSRRASILCHEDSKVYCLECDAKVHEKCFHTRVTLGGPAPSQVRTDPIVPICDICQETPATVSCVNDRSLLCLKCDIFIHNSTPIGQLHDRFVFTGARVGLCSVQSIHSSFLKDSWGGSASRQSRSEARRQNSNTTKSQDNSEAPVVPTMAKNQQSRPPVHDDFDFLQMVPTVFEDGLDFESLLNSVLDDDVQSKGEKRKAPPSPIYDGMTFDSRLSSRPIDDFFTVPDFQNYKFQF